MIKNKEKDNGIEINKFINNILLNMDKRIKNVEFELTTDDGKILNHNSKNKVKFSLKRK